MKNIIISAVVAAVVAVIVVVVGGNNQSPAQDTNLGATGTRFPYGVSVGYGRGNGCYEIYATSSATAGKLVASTTATIEGVDGVMMFQFGRCLN